MNAEAAVPFEAKIEVSSGEGGDAICWAWSDIRPPLLKQAAEMFKEGLTVREVAAILRISKSEAGRLRLQAVGDERPHRSSDDKRALPSPNSQMN